VQSIGGNSKTESLLSGDSLDSSVDGPQARIALGNAPAGLAPHQVRYHTRGRETVARAVLIKQLASVCVLHITHLCLHHMSFPLYYGANDDDCDLIMAGR
jgi:hypothetical protein